MEGIPEKFSSQYSYVRNSNIYYQNETEKGHLKE